MNVIKLKECGYEESVLGFSLSYNSTIERTRDILPKYAFGKSGESKFLESIQIWVDVTAPRFWWQEADTYRVGTSKQSESTMHTLMKKPLTQGDFEYEVFSETIESLNSVIETYKYADPIWKNQFFVEFVKNNLPEGFLQRRIWNFNYKVLQHMYNQRFDHKLPQWKIFLSRVILEIEHPEFIIKDYYSNKGE